MIDVISDMAGSVWRIEVKENEAVMEGDVLVILESMKMEIPIEATHSGMVASIDAAEGDFVNEGDCLLKIRID